MRASDSAWQASLCANWAVPCSFNLIVVAFTTCIYELVAADSLTPIQLSPGLEVEGEADGGGVTYFVFSLFNAPPNTVVVISVLPTSGDPDLYVGTSNVPATLRPTPGDRASYLWSSSGVGTELLSIETASDPRACTNCNYTIGVAGYLSNTTFSITARLRDGTPVRLTPGAPVLDFVDFNAFSRFVTTFDRRLNFSEITVSPISGDPDMYVSLGPGAVPSKTSFNYSAFAATGDEDVLILPTDAAFTTMCGWSPTAPCDAAVAVFGFSPSAYIITASNGLRLLTDGRSTVGQVAAGALSYFAIDIQGGVGLRPVTITLSPIGRNADPDLYVNVGSKPAAGTAGWAWSSLNAIGPEVLFLDPSDARMRNACPLSTFACRIFIGVHGYGVRAKFSISAGSASASALAAGTPALATVPAGGLTYFTFYVDAFMDLSQGLEFVVTPTAGASDVLLFVGATLDPLTKRTKFPAKVCNDVSGWGGARARILHATR